MDTDTQRAELQASMDSLNASMDDLNAAIDRRLAEIAELRSVLRVIDSMPVDGCSPTVIESLFRQAKWLANTALNARRDGKEE